jgi:hypothetical protein
MLPSNMLRLNLIPLIDVTFSTLTPVFVSRQQKGRPEGRLVQQSVCRAVLLTRTHFRR